MLNHDVIIKPLLSEKSYAELANKKYTFIVAKSANKVQVKKAVEEIFGVKVEKVNIANYDGKLKTPNTLAGRTKGYTNSYKKAYVKLTAESKNIEFFDSLQ